MAGDHEPVANIDLGHGAQLSVPFVPHAGFQIVAELFGAAPAYLDPIVQEGMSCFAQLDPDIRRRGTERLRADLESGAWDERHGHLRELPEIDMGYRLLVAGDHLS